MRRNVERFKETLHGFIDQSDDLLLVLDAVDLDMALVHKVLESVDQEQPADIVLRFAETATGPEQYVTAVLDNLRTQMTAVNMLREQESLPPWAPLPAECDDLAAAPAERLKAAMQHVRSLFPEDEDHRIVWCLLPVELPDPAAYLGVVGGLVPRDGIQPWMQSQRIIVRDRRDDRVLIPHLNEQDIDNTLLLPVDFSTDAMVDGLVEEVGDPDTPEPQRMQNLLLLANIDYSHKRFGDAVDKYRVLYNYHGKQEQPVMQAMCIGGVGDVLMSNGDDVGAKEKYQQGLALSAPAKVRGLPITMMLCAHTGDVCMRLEEYDQAEGYYDNASQVAGGLLNLEFKCDMMEKVGMAQRAQQRVGDAVATWKLTIDRCKDADYFLRWGSTLDNLIDAYDEAGMTAERRQAQRERDGLQHLQKQRASQ